LLLLLGVLGNSQALQQREETQPFAPHTFSSNQSMASLKLLLCLVLLAAGDGAFLLRVVTPYCLDLWKHSLVMMVLATSSKVGSQKL
jgi:hypothetical protein